MLLVPVLACVALGATAIQSPVDSGLGDAPRVAALDERGYPAGLVSDLTEILRRARDPEAPERPELADALARLGRPAVDPLLDLLELRKIPAAHAGQRPQTLSVYQEEVLLEGLGKLGLVGVLQRMERRLADGSEPNRRRAALRLFGRLGDRTHLARMLEAAAPVGEEPVDEALEDELRGALKELLAREPLAVPRLCATWRSIPPALLPAVIFALGDARDGRGLSFVVDAAFAHPELLAVAAAQIAMIGRSPDVAVNRRAIEFLRDSRDKASLHVACGLTRALGVLEDDGSIQDWIDDLSADSEARRSAALWSLRRISQVDFSADAETWQVWWDAELDWFDSDYERLLGDLAARDGAVLARALRELAGRRVRRHEIAAEVTALLEDPRPATRGLACGALLELGSIDALPALAGALRDEDPDVAQAAWRALAGLSGRHFELDSPEWGELVASREP